MDLTGLKRGAWLRLKEPVPMFPGAHYPDSYHPKGSVWEVDWVEEPGIIGRVFLRCPNLANGWRPFILRFAASAWEVEPAVAREGAS